jgi:hypothetical protein
MLKKMSTAQEAAKLVKKGIVAYIKPEDFQLFGQIYGRAFSFRGTGYNDIIGTYYIVSRHK